MRCIRIPAEFSTYVADLDSRGLTHKFYERTVWGSPTVGGNGTFMDTEIAPRDKIDWYRGNYGAVMRFTASPEIRRRRPFKEDHAWLNLTGSRSFNKRHALPDRVWSALKVHSSPVSPVEDRLQERRPQPLPPVT